MLNELVHLRTKRKYMSITTKKKLDLVNLFDSGGITIKEAAIRLNLNYSTAKHIIKIYKRGEDHSYFYKCLKKPTLSTKNVLNP